MELRLLVLASFALVCACDTFDFRNDCAAGEVAVRESQHAKGVDLLSRCLAKNGLEATERARNLKLRAWAHYSLRQDTQAVADQDAAFRLSSKFEYRDYINFAMYLRRVGRYQDSLRAVRSAEEVEETKGHPAMMTQYHLGWSLSALDRNDEAVQAFTRGIPDQPDYPFVYWRRGLAYEALHQSENARADFDRFAQKLTASETERLASEEMLPEIRGKLKEYGLNDQYRF